MIAGLDPTVIVAILAFLGVVAAPIGAYVVASRRLSGKIGTSDAEQLWAESKAIREDYRGRLSEANDRIDRLEARIDQLESANAVLVQEKHALEQEVEYLRTTLGGLR